MKILLPAAILFLLFVSCQKEKDVAPQSGNSGAFSYISLIPESDTILTGTKTKVIATATGEGLNYQWEGPVGIITGAGHQVFFFACCPGDHYITCTVTDSKGNSSAKTINVYGL